MQIKRRIDDPDLNPDPITNAPGSHPIGTGIGAAAGGAAVAAGAIAAGAAIGAVAGPVGAALGVAVGAVAGGLIGKGVAEGVNPTLEEKYWRETYASRSYVPAGASYDHYAPAYQFGWEAYGENFGKEFDQVEPFLANDWDQEKGNSPLVWEQAKPASRDAWERLASSKHP